MRALLLRSAEYAATPALPRFAAVLSDVMGRGNVDAHCWRTNPRGITPVAPGDPARVSHYERAANSRSLSAVVGLPLWLASIARRLIGGRYDVVQASDVFSLLPCILLRPVCGYRVIGDVRDHVASISGTHWGVKAKILGWLESALLSRSDAVIVVDETRRELLPPRVVQNGRVIVVRNLPMVDVGYAVPVESGRVTVNFSGYLSRMRGADLLMAAVSGAESVTLEVVGETNDVELANELARTPGALCRGRVSHAEAMRLMGAADVISLLYDPAIAANRYAAPNKFYEAMMVGRPVIVSEGTPMAEWVRAEKCGYVVPYGDVAALRAQLVGIRADRAAWRSKCARARDYFLKELQWPTEATRLAAAYRQVLQGTTRERPDRSDGYRG